MRIFSPFRYGPKRYRSALERKAYMNQSVVSYQSRAEYADKMRGEPTECERKLFNALKGLGYHFESQHILLGKYIIDIYCPSHRLVIEVDGYHHKEGAQLTIDQRRDSKLILNGYKVLRFSNQEVKYNLGSVINKIRSTISGKISTLF